MHTGNAELQFDINAGLLHGTVGGRHTAILAASGGGGGAKTTGRRLYDDMRAVNNPFRTGQKADAGKHRRGGSLPPGSYRIEPPAHHPHLGFASALTPMVVPHLHHRGGFFIHGRGRHGSDGCVVPMNAHEFQQLMAGLAQDGGGRLIVHAIRDLPAGRPTSAIA